MPKKSPGYVTVKNPAAVLARDPLEYSMEALLNPTAWTEREMRKEYARLRAIANKRLEALGRSEFAWSRAYQENKAGFAPLPKSAKRREVAAALKKVTGYVSAKTSSVTGQRDLKRRTIATLKSQGWDIQARDYRELGLFWEYVRDNYSGQIRASTDVQDMFFDAKRLGLSINDLVANFEYWREHASDMENAKKIRPAKGKKTPTSADLARDLGLKDYKKKRNVNLDNYHTKKMSAKTGG